MLADVRRGLEVHEGVDQADEHREVILKIALEFDDLDAVAA